MKPWRPARITALLVGTVAYALEMCRRDGVPERGSRQYARLRYGRTFAGPDATDDATLVAFDEFCKTARQN